MISFSEWIEIKEGWLDDLKNRFSSGGKPTPDAVPAPTAAQQTVKPAPKPVTPTMRIFSAADFEGIFEEFKKKHGNMDAEKFILKMLETAPKGVSGHNRPGLTDFARGHGMQLYWIDGEKNRVHERVGDIIEKHGNLRGVDINGTHPGYHDLYGNLTQIKPIIAKPRFIVSWGEWTAR